MIARPEEMVSFIETLRANSTSDCMPHEHDFYEINYLTNGKTKMKINGLLLSYEAYDFVFIPPGVRHNLFYTKGERYNNYNIRFRDNACLLSTICEEDQAVKIHDYNGEIQYLCSEIFRICHNDNIKNQQILNVYLYLILMYMRDGSRLDTMQLNNRDEDLVENAIRMINDRISKEPVTVSIIANELGLSSAYFTRLFQRRIGIAPVKYIIDVKVAKAKQMLSETDYSIKQIALILHYDDQFYFSRQFTKAVGISPRAYRTESSRQQK